MKPFIFNQWHAWESNGKILLSNEAIKQLKQFTHVDDCINWLYLSGYTLAARALNANKKETAK